jgi:hypothetical protein
MSLKLYALLLIGVVVGSSVGYGISLVYTPPFLEDVLPNNYKTKLDELTQQHPATPGPEYPSRGSDLRPRGSPRGV